MADNCTNCHKIISHSEYDLNEGLCSDCCLGNDDNTEINLDGGED